MTPVRRITADDDDGVRALAALRTTWASDDAGLTAGHEQRGHLDGQFQAAFAAWFRSQDRVFFLAVDDDGVEVGMCNVAFFRRMPKPGSPPSCWAYLANVYVAPGHRRVGAGSSLVKAAMECARAAGAVRLVTAPSEQSRSLYGRHGFGAADGLLVLQLD